VWDEPAIAAMTALKAAGRQLPMTAVDLVNEVAIELAHGGMIKGIGAKQPYAQGEAIARACILSLLGEQVASWVVLLGIRVGTGKCGGELSGGLAFGCAAGVVARAVVTRRMQ
jgi:ribose transport system substrate-binding protein